MMGLAPRPRRRPRACRPALLALEPRRLLDASAPEPIAAPRDVAGAARASLLAPVATIHAADPHATADRFVALIDWGDDSTTTGTVVPHPGPAARGADFDVIGSHYYATPGTYRIRVGLGDRSGWQAQVAALARIGEPVPSRPGVPGGGTSGGGGPQGGEGPRGGGCTDGRGAVAGRARDFATRIADLLGSPGAGHRGGAGDRAGPARRRAVARHAVVSLLGAVARWLRWAEPHQPRRPSKAPR